MAPWGGEYKGGDTGIKATKPPDSGGGLKGGDKYAGGLTEDVRTGTSAAATGAENICNAGMIYAPELSALFAGEL
jgi:hypothetical protein